MREFVNLNNKYNKTLTDLQGCRIIIESEVIIYE